MFDVVIDELVFRQDFKRIDKRSQQKIIRAIRKKLATEPESYGKPLRGDLKGFWKLRIGEYRVIYTIDKGRVEVYVVVVGFRRDEEVYREVAKRLELY